MRQFYYGWGKGCPEEARLKLKTCELCVHLEGDKSQGYLPASLGRNACVDTQTPEANTWRETGRL